MSYVVMAFVWDKPFLTFGCFTPTCNKEARSKDVKQSNRKKKQTLFMPLVAPVRGVHPTIVWGVAWKDVASKVGRNFDSAPLGPLLPALDAEGKWLKRTVDSQEASAWLTQLLRKRDPSMERVTTHSLKHTPLGWLSKFGIYGETQTLLSHHSTGSFEYVSLLAGCLEWPFEATRTTSQADTTWSLLPRQYP